MLQEVNRYAWLAAELEGEDSDFARDIREERAASLYTATEHFYGRTPLYGVEPDATSLVEDMDDAMYTTRKPEPHEKMLLESIGVVSIPTEAKSLREVAEENPSRFGTSLNFLPNRILDFTPRAMVIAMNPDHLVITDSLGMRKDPQVRIIGAFSHPFRTELPDIRGVMLRASVLAQANLIFTQYNDGEFLMPQDSSTIVLDGVAGETFYLSHFRGKMEIADRITPGASLGAMPGLIFATRGRYPTYPARF